MNSIVGTFSMNGGKQSGGLAQQLEALQQHIGGGEGDAADAAAAATLVEPATDEEAADAAAAATLVEPATDEEAAKAKAATDEEAADAAAAATLVEPATDEEAAKAKAPGANATAPVTEPEADYAAKIHEDALRVRDILNDPALKEIVPKETTAGGKAKSRKGRRTKKGKKGNRKTKKSRKSKRSKRSKKSKK